MTLTWKRKSEVIQPMDAKPFKFLIKSYGEIDRLVSARRKILMNLQYGLAMQTLGWPQLLPLGCLAPCWGRESHPSLRGSFCAECATRQQPAHPRGTGHGARIKAGRDLCASLLCRPCLWARNIRDLTIRLL